MARLQKTKQAADYIVEGFLHALYLTVLTLLCGYTIYFYWNDLFSGLVGIEKISFVSACGLFWISKMFTDFIDKKPFTYLGKTIFVLMVGYGLVFLRDSDIIGWLYTVS